jgi:hypothetical protein
LAQPRRKSTTRSGPCGETIEENRLKTDVSDRLVKLNELRKDVSYGDPGEELSEVNLEDLVSDLDLFLGEVDELMRNIEKD